MDSLAVSKRTHSRAVFVGVGLLFAFFGFATFVLATLLVISTTEMPLGRAVLGWGYGVAILLFGLLLTGGTPTTGSLKWKLRLYKLQLAIVTSIPLAASLLAFALGDREAGVTILIPLGLLYLTLQVDWSEARRHLEEIRTSDDPGSVQFIPPKSLTLARHVLYGTFVMFFGYLFVTFASGTGTVTVTPLTGALVVLAFLVAGVAVIAAVPHRGSVERTVLAMRIGVLGPGVCFLLAGFALFADGDSLVVASVFSLFGVALLYLGLVHVSWDVIEQIVEELQTGDVATWSRARKVIEARESRR